MGKKTKGILAALAAVVVLGAAVFLTVENRSYWQRLLYTRQGHENGHYIDLLTYKNDAEYQAGAAYEKIWLEIPEQPNYFGDTRIRQAAYLPGKGIYVAVTTGLEHPLFFLVEAGGEVYTPKCLETYGLSRKLLECFYEADLGPEPVPFMLRFYVSVQDFENFQLLREELGAVTFQ